MTEGINIGYNWKTNYDGECKTLQKSHLLHNMELKWAFVDEEIVSLSSADISFSDYSVSPSSGRRRETTSCFNSTIAIRIMFLDDRCKLIINIHAP